jgi:hypothetical protein
MDMRADGLTPEIVRAPTSIPFPPASLVESVRRPRPCWRVPRGPGRCAFAAGERYHLIKRKCDHEQLRVLREFPALPRWDANKSAASSPVKRMVRIRPFGRLASPHLGLRAERQRGRGPGGRLCDRWLGGVKAGKRLERRFTGGVWMPDGQRRRTGPRARQRRAYHHRHEPAGRGRCRVGGATPHERRTPWLRSGDGDRHGLHQGHQQPHAWQRQHLQRGLQLRRWRCYGAGQFVQDRRTDGGL